MSVVTGTAPLASRFVLGMGGTVDYEIAWDPEVLGALAAEYAISPEELAVDVPIGTERDLLVALLAFVRDGVGGERFVASSEIVERFAARFEKEITLGGTCVRAAIAMRLLGVASTLHLVSIDDHVRRLLPEGVGYVCSADADTTDPHLIVQYPAGTRIRGGAIDVVAPQPNRIIFANDPPHRELVVSEDLGPALAEAQVFLLSSFNVIQDAAVMEDRLAAVLRHAERLPGTATVVFEDAGYHVPELRWRVRDRLAPLVHVWSMNEDELQNYLGRRIDLLDPAEISAALDEIRALIPARTIVVHTRFWALATGDSAAGYAEALRGGIATASARYRHGDHLTVAEHAAIVDAPRHPGGERFAAELEARLGALVRCIPAFELDVASPTTIGLGDAFVGGFLAALVPGATT